MKYSKQPSLTSDTRLSRSGIFNNSCLNQSTQALEQPRNQYLSHNIQQSQNKQVEFLRFKNSELEQKNRRLTAYVKQLQGNKNEILAINSKYVDVVNRYYENENHRVEKSTSKKGREVVGGAEVHRALEKLEKDHRNLVKHCLAMQQEIKNYTSQMVKFETMKKQLQSVNHVSVQDLIDQIQDLSQQNKNLRKLNNQISYDLQKSKQQCKKVKKLHSNKQKQAGDSTTEVSKMKCLVNTIQQESIDKANRYEARIYQLELKVEKLEKQLREQQETVTKTKDQHKDLAIKQVEQVHEYEKLQRSFTDLLQTRDRSLSMYSKPRAVPNSRNVLENSLNYAIAKQNPTIKNPRRSLATKSIIIL